MKVVEVWSDSNECFAQIDEEGDMKNAVGMEMAKVNAIIAKKLLQERMRRNPKSTNEISLEYNKFISIGVGNGSPVVGCHLVVTWS